ncbi:uncharacterized protein TrAFT101_002472 [Trichoderma asperellum]|uniref:uncharacterized protein n=1 Tax=Trichoderma asperellum TaxID=101201 RepID=UPI00331B7C00|nr:hypothetical protein TrAFT101_002472 [Trichoderma asperellum]
MTVFSIRESSMTNTTQWTAWARYPIRPGVDGIVNVSAKAASGRPFARWLSAELSLPGAEIRSRQPNAWLFALVAWPVEDSTVGRELAAVLV